MMAQLLDVMRKPDPSNRLVERRCRRYCRRSMTPRDRILTALRAPGAPPTFSSVRALGAFVGFVPRKDTGHDNAALRVAQRAVDELIRDGLIERRPDRFPMQFVYALARRRADRPADQHAEQPRC